MALATHPPAPGDRVSGPFLEVVARETEEAGLANVDFRLGDVQIVDLGRPFDYVFSRMGVMFFADPVAALRNGRGAMRPGARLCCVVWRRTVDNAWLWEGRVGGRALPRAARRPTSQARGRGRSPGRTPTGSPGSWGTSSDRGRDPRPRWRSSRPPTESSPRPRPG